MVVIFFFQAEDGIRDIGVTGVQTCSRTIYNNAVKVGLAGKIEKSGADFKCDSCTCLTPYVTKDRYDAVITNSVKGAYYLSKSNKVKVALKDIKTIAEEYTQ